MLMKKVNIHVTTTTKIGKISPLIYGHFAEHIGVLIDGNNARIGEITLLSANNPCSINDFDEPNRISPKTETASLQTDIVLPRASVVKISLKREEKE